MVLPSDIFDFNSCMHKFIATPSMAECQVAAMSLLHSIHGFMVSFSLHCKYD